MDKPASPLHKLCVDKASCRAEQDKTQPLLADLTKDAFRKRLKEEALQQTPKK